MLSALGVFAVASLAGGLASSGAVLIGARFVKGAAAAFTAPAGLSIITTTFGEGPVRNRALSLYGATGASGFSLGLVIGGLTTQVSWRLAFLLPAPFAVALLAAGHPADRSGDRRGVPPLNIQAVTGVAAHEQGVAGAIFQASNQIGTAVVLAAVTAVVTSDGGASTQRAVMLAAYRYGLLVVVAVAAAGLLIALPALVRRPAAGPTRQPGRPGPAGRAAHDHRPEKETR